MKKICIAAMTFVTLLALVVSGSVYAAALKKNEAEVTFATDIQSKHCKDRVEKVVPFEKGVQDMDIKIPEGRVYIKFRTDKTSVETLKKTIEDMGYSVKVAGKPNNADKPDK
jgi:copper chaperone CopZ